MYPRKKKKKIIELDKSKAADYSSSAPLFCVALYLRRLSSGSLRLPLNYRNERELSVSASYIGYTNALFLRASSCNYAAIFKRPFGRLLKHVVVLSMLLRLLRARWIIMRALSFCSEFFFAILLSNRFDRRYFVTLSIILEY